MLIKTPARTTGGIEDHQSVFECHQCRFDFAETLIDLVGHFIRILMVEFELGLLGVECVDGRLLLDGEIGRFALQLMRRPIRLCAGPTAATRIQRFRN